MRLKLEAGKAWPWSPGASGHIPILSFRDVTPPLPPSFSLTDVCSAGLEKKRWRGGRC